MAKFIQCNTESVKYFDYEFKNSPVNIELVVFMSKDSYTIGDDTEGLPTITFGGNVVVWRYERHGGEAMRDAQFEHILKDNS